MARGSAKKKLKIREWLLNRDTARVVTEPRAASVLLSVLFEDDALLRWRAIEALGAWAKLTITSNPEKVREIVRRMFWAMNDESGGFIWMAPQTVAYILRCVPTLIDEYGLMLISKMREEPFVTGVMWAAYYLGDQKHIISKWSDEIKVNCKSDIPEARIYATAALLRAEVITKEKIDAKILNDQRILEEYDFEKGEFVSVSASNFIASYC